MSLPVKVCQLSSRRIAQKTLQRSLSATPFAIKSRQENSLVVKHGFTVYKSNASFTNSNSILRSIKQTRHYTSMPSFEKVMMPNLSPTMETGSIVSWEKEVGDRVNEGEVLALIETDKSTMEMETPEEGYLAAILLPAGTKDVPINKLIAVIVAEEEDVAAFAGYTGEADAPSTPAPSSTPAATPEPSVVPIAAPVAVEMPPPVSSTNRVFASPLAKRVALERGIDINKVSGSGPRGRITVEDIEAYTPASAAPLPPVTPSATPTFTPPPPAVGASFTDMELTGMRKAIAERLTTSKQTIPHYYLSADINMDEVLSLRQELNSEGTKLSVNDFVIKASALALLKVPECNSQWHNTFIRQFNNVDISVAVSTEGGLITPIVSDADKKGLQSINSDVVELARKAREKTIQPHEYMGGTFTISNLGMYGVKSFSAVINPPQSCILAVGGTEDRVLPDASTENGMRVSKVMNVTLGCDHRVVDGAVGASWLKTFKSYLEKPLTMLL